MAFKFVSIIFLILFLSKFTSGQQFHTPLSQKEIDDSVACEKMQEWNKNIEYVDYDYVGQTPLSELETDRDSLQILQFIQGCNELMQTFKYYQRYPASMETNYNLI